MRFEKSCGAVVYNIVNNNIEFLIIKHSSGEHWGFPKGHVEALESERETALREIKEETGLSVEIIQEFIYRMKYSPKASIVKEVVYFLAKSDDREVLCQISEISEFKWLTLKEAIKVVTHENSRKLLREAYFFIKDKVNNCN